MSRRGAAALAVALVAFGAYLATAPAAPGAYDVAEAQTVPYIFGIAHETGFPAYVLSGWLASHALPLGTVAWRLNAFAALWTALAAGGVASLAGELGASVAAGAAAALLFAFGRQAWYAGTHADPHAMLLALLVWTLVFALRYAARGSGRDLLAAAFACGVGLATHPFALFALPSLGLAALARGRPPARLAALALAAVLAPAVLYGYLPLRSAYVADHQLDPTAAPPLDGTGTIAWDLNHPRTLSGFLDETLGRPGGAGGKLAAAGGPAQVAGGAALLVRSLGFELPYAGLALALAALGSASLAIRRPLALAMVLCPLIAIPAFTAAYGVSGSDIARYLVPDFALLAALGAAASRLPLPAPRPARLAALVVAVALAVAAAAGVREHAGAAMADRRDPAGETTIAAVAAAVPDGAYVVTSWEDATTLAYGAYVEERLGRRVIVLGWPHQFADRFDAMTARRRVFVLGRFPAILDLTALVGYGRIAPRPIRLPGRALYELLARDAAGNDSKNAFGQRRL